MSFTHFFKVGDRVFSRPFEEFGEICVVDKDDLRMSYRVKIDSDKELYDASYLGSWHSSDELDRVWKLDDDGYPEPPKP